MPDTEMCTEIWTYIGLREQKSGAFAHGWRDPQGDVYVFRRNFRQVSIGGQIEVTLTRDGKVIVSGPDAPKPLLSRYENNDEIAAWVAADECARTAKRLKAIERQAAKAVPLEDTIFTVRRLSAELTAVQKRALVAVLLEAVYTHE